MNGKIHHHAHDLNGHGRHVHIHDGDVHSHHHHDHPPERGHNGPDALQWQVLHREQEARPKARPEDRDLDLVEAAFVAAFPDAADPVSFLRLAGVIMRGRNANGQTLQLIRVEIGSATHVGSVSPLLGGAGLRCDPLPARMVSRQQKLRFVYFDGAGVCELDLAHARALTPD